VTIRAWATGDDGRIVTAVVASVRTAPHCNAPDRRGISGSRCAAAPRVPPGLTLDNDTASP